MLVFRDIIVCTVGMRKAEMRILMRDSSKGAVIAIAPP
jgi:hypothetical protein